MLYEVITMRTEPHNIRNAIKPESASIFSATTNSKTSFSISSTFASASSGDSAQSRRLTARTLVRYVSTRSLRAFFRRCTKPMAALTPA